MDCLKALNIICDQSKKLGATHFDAIAGESESMSFISTGGGAALQLLEGKHMPGLAALPNRL